MSFETDLNEELADEAGTDDSAMGSGSTAGGASGPTHDSSSTAGAPTGAAHSSAAASAAANAAHTAVSGGTHALESATVWSVNQLRRPRTRTTLVGILLIVLGAVVVTHSVWTFPLVILGIIMVVVAWVGSRLEGRFALEWSEMGAGFELRARFKPTPESAPPPAPALPVTIARDDVVVEEPVIEGEAHTVEIDVQELKALIAAADRAAGVADSTTSPAVAVSYRQAPNGAAQHPHHDD
jgi:hypothetical protein